MTFYRHYADKSALLQVIEDKVFEQLQALLEPPASLEAIERVTRKLLRYVQDNSATFRAVGQTPAMNSILNRMTARGLEDLSQLLSGDLAEPTEKARLLREMAATHFVFAQLNLIRWWSSA